MFVANNHDYMFSLQKKEDVFWLRVFEIPEGAKDIKRKSYSKYDKYSI